MQPIRRILVAVKNPQARSLPAVHKAAQIAKGLNAQLTLFHDIATPLYAEALQGRGVDLNSVKREVHTSRREQLDRLAMRIRKHDIDVDVAAESSQLTKSQILSQAGMAVLSQANQIPQSALSLLR